MSNSAVQQTPPMSIEDFLSFADRKPKHEHWELLDGAPVMMVGGTEGQALIVGNLLSPLRPAAQRRGCRAMTGLFTRAVDKSMFEPDVVIRCGAIDPRKLYADDPAVVIEVLSPSAMRYDRVFKFERYREIPSLRQIVFVYQDSVRVESWLRGPDEWDEEATVLLSLNESLALPAIEASLPLSTVYEDVADALRRSRRRLTPLPRSPLPPPSRPRCARPRPRARRPAWKRR